MCGDEKPVTRVLIVDEARACSEELRQPLQSQGLGVVSLTDYREAIRALRTTDEPFDLVILNIAECPRRGLEWLQQTSAIRLKLGLPAGHVFCVAAGFLDPQLELEIEACGGRVVYEQ